MADFIHLGTVIDSESVTELGSMALAKVMDGAHERVFNLTVHFLPTNIEFRALVLV